MCSLFLIVTKKNNVFVKRQKTDLCRLTPLARTEKQKHWVHVSLRQDQAVIPSSKYVTWHKLHTSISWAHLFSCKKRLWELQSLNEKFITPGVEQYISIWISNLYTNSSLFWFHTYSTEGGGGVTNYRLQTCAKLAWNCMGPKLASALSTVNNNTALWGSTAHQHMSTEGPWNSTACYFHQRNSTVCSK